MSKYFNGDKLSGYEDSPITYVHGNIEKFNKVIADLETKLAESEKKYEDRKRFCISEIRSQTEIINNLLEEIEELKQQLAEKDKELAHMTEQAKKFNNEAQKYFEDAYCNDFHKRDKISFAVEQLEEVKNKIESKVESIHKILYDLNIKIVCESTSRELSAYEEIIKEIDNQIKELK